MFAKHIWQHILFKTTGEPLQHLSVTVYDNNCWQCQSLWTRPVLSLRWLVGRCLECSSTKMVLYWAAELLSLLKDCLPCRLLQKTPCRTERTWRIDPSLAAVHSQAWADKVKRWKLVLHIKHNIYLEVNKLRYLNSTTSCFAQLYEYVVIFPQLTWPQRLWRNLSN